MDRSLKRVYEQKKQEQKELLELLAKDYERRFTVIQEVIDDQKMQAMIDKLNNIEKVIGPVKDKLPSLATALNRARDVALSKLGAQTAGEQGAAKGGGMLKKMFGAAKGAVKSKLVDDLNDFIKFEAGILKGLKQIPKIVDLIQKSVPNADDNTTLNDIVSGVQKQAQQNKPKGPAKPLEVQKDPFPQQKSREDFEKDMPTDAYVRKGTVIKEANGDVGDLAKRILPALQQAFVPPKEIFKDASIPWIDTNKLAQEMLGLTVGQVKQLGQSAASGLEPLPLKPQEVQQLQQNLGTAKAGGQEAKGQAALGGKATTSTGTTKASEPAAPSGPGATGDAAKARTAGQRASQPVNDDVIGILSDLLADAPATKGVDKNTVRAVLTTLNQGGHLKECFLVRDPRTGKKKYLIP